MDQEGQRLTSWALALLALCALSVSSVLGASPASDVSSKLLLASLRGMNRPSLLHPVQKAFMTRYLYKW